MKAIKWMCWGIIVISLTGSSLSLASPKTRPLQSDKLVFCETYSRQEILTRLQTWDPLFSFIEVDQGDPESSRIGHCPKAKLDQLLDYVRSEPFKNRVPADLIVVAGTEDQAEKVPVYAIRRSGSDQSFPSKKDIRKVEVDYYEPNDSYMLTITFSDSATGKWAALTKKNIGKDIAVLYNDRVLSAPRVRDEIKGGKCSISGNYTEQDVLELKQILEH